MAYHPLTNDSGGDNQSRVAEMADLVDKLSSYMGDLSEKETSFIESMEGAETVSVKQIFWARDIYARVL